MQYAPQNDPDSPKERLRATVEGMLPTIQQYFTDAVYGIINLLKTFITAIWR